MSGSTTDMPAARLAFALVLVALALLGGGLTFIVSRMNRPAAPWRPFWGDPS